MDISLVGCLAFAVRHVYYAAFYYSGITCRITMLVAYFTGPPERIELVTLTTQLTRTVGSEWKLLAAPLNIDDADVNSIDYEQKTLKLKINELLKIWVDRDEQNDRTRLAQLLTSLDGYNLVRACQESLRKL